MRARLRKSSRRQRAHRLEEVRLALESDAWQGGQVDVSADDVHAIGRAAAGLEQIGSGQRLFSLERSSVLPILDYSDASGLGRILRARLPARFAERTPDCYAICGGASR